MRKCVSLMAMILGLWCASGWAITPNQTVRPKRVEKISQLMDKLGSGEDSLVAVKMTDKTAVAGHVEELGPDYATVVDRKTGEAVKVSYYRVEKLQGYNVATKTEVHEGTGIQAKIARTMLKVIPGQQVPVNSLTGSNKTLLIGIIIGIILAIILAKVL